MDDIEVFQLVGGLFVALAISALVFALAYPYFSGDKQGEQRLQAVSETKSKRASRRGQSAIDTVANNRRKQVANTLKELENRHEKQSKLSLRQKLEQTGLDVTPKAYYIASAVSGAILGLVFLLSFPNVTILASIGAAFAGGIGVPHWVLAYMIKKRKAKFVAEFANAIDVVVRGVKTGLPLNECLNIIARESPEPICTEFREVVEQQRVGVPLGEALERLAARVPLPETRFFSIVISIQQSAGGNLSEALGNLSGVLRDRSKMQMKVAALSSEAKASAGVLASLPFVVMLLVYLSTPKYIAMLWTTKSGNFMLGIAGFWMTCGILVMRKMINFKY
jgi:tight adherence protein B